MTNRVKGKMCVSLCTHAHFDVKQRKLFSDLVVNLRLPGNGMEVFGLFLRGVLGE